MGKRWNGILVNSFLLCLSIVTALVLGEIFIRIFYPQDLILNISQWDSYTGFSNIPGIEGFTRRKDFTMHIKINSKGLRDKEYAYKKMPNTIRIGVFGDSFTFGEGVQNDETYPKILEKLFQANEEINRNKFKVEVLNFGIGKTGTSHQLAFFKKEGKKYDLDLVIVGFLARNDFGDNLGGVYYLENNRIVHRPTAYSSIRKIQKIVYSIPFYRWATANSHLVNLFRYLATKHDDRKRFQSGFEANLKSANTALNTSAVEISLTCKLLEEFNKEALQDKASLIVVNLPAKNQKPLRGYLPGEDIPDFCKKCEELFNKINNKGIRTLDLTPVFSKLPVLPYYFEHDGHMSTVGQRVVAAQIYNYVLPDILSLIKSRGSRGAILKGDTP